MTCILCGTEPPFRPFYARDGWTMVRCPSCRLVFQHPQPSDEALAATYYHDAEWTREIEHELRGLVEQRARANHGLLRAAGVVPASAKAAQFAVATGGEASTSAPRALDVGASSGAWLEEAAREGWQVTGVELGAATAEAARTRGLDVRTGTLADVAPQLDAGGFDLVTFWDVLEHLRDPREELALARSLLAPGGVLAAAMPNVEGWYPRATYRLLARTTGRWEYPELPVHLYDFAPATITRLLENAGFGDVRVRTYATPFWYYRWTSISPGVLGHGRKGRLLRAAFEALAIPIYPAATRADRGNALFVTARR